MNIKFARLTYILIEFIHMQLIFTHLELWLAVARHDFKWVEMYFM